MANRIEKTNSTGLSRPIVAMIVMALAGGLLVGLSFVVIQYWPLPVAVAPYYEGALFPTGFAWGFVAGAFFGFIIGLLTDESNFVDVKYE